MLTRRETIGAALGALIAASVGGVPRWCTPAQAAAAGAAFTHLTAGEGELLGSLAEAIVPGARAAGCAYFVDHHVGVATADSLLSLKFLDIRPPYLPFYKLGLAGLRKHIGGRPVRDWEKVVHELLSGALPDWAGPPAQLFYLAVRLDAIDVVFGSHAGFQRYGVPYLAHIDPEKEW